MLSLARAWMVDHIGLTFDNENHVADQGLIEDGIDHGAVIDPALRLAANGDPRLRRMAAPGLANGRNLSAPRRRR
jgi:hypothetical protein